MSQAGAVRLLHCGAAPPAICENCSDNTDAKAFPRLASQASPSPLLSSPLLSLLSYPLIRQRINSMIPERFLSLCTSVGRENILEKKKKSHLVRTLLAHPELGMHKMFGCAISKFIFLAKKPLTHRTIEFGREHNFQYNSMR